MTAALACPHCKAPLAANPEVVGSDVVCYLCQKTFNVRVGLDELVAANSTRPATVIDVIESYLGGELFDSEAAERLCEVPLDHLDELFSNLNRFYEDWLENQVEARWGNVSTPECHLFVPYPPDYAAQAHLQQCKKLLLYLPRITWHDPLADELIPAFWSARITGSVSSEMLSRALSTGLRSLALLAPLVRGGDLTLVPHPAVLNYSILQMRAQAELERISDVEREEALSRYANSARTTQAIEGFGFNAVFEASKVWGHFCALMQYSPVACDPLVCELIAAEYSDQSYAKTRLPQITHRVATSLFQYDLPGVAALPLDRLISLRTDVEAFRAWRRGIEEFMEYVRSEDPKDSEQQNVELRQAGEAILRPKIESLDKDIRGSSALEKIIIPGAVAASSMMLTWHLTDSLPVSTGISGMLTTGSWVLDKIRHQFSRKTTKASAVREIYNVMLETATG